MTPETGKKRVAVFKKLQLQQLDRCCGHATHSVAMNSVWIMEFMKQVFPRLIKPVFPVSDFPVCLKKPEPNELVWEVHALWFNTNLIFSSVGFGRS